MPPETPNMQQPMRDMRRQVFLVAGILAVALLAAGYWWQKQITTPQTHDDFYNLLVEENSAFAEAEQEAGTGNFATALSLYDKALLDVDDNSRSEILFLKARALVQVADLKAAVPVLKEVIAETSEMPRARATAIGEMAEIASRGNADANIEIFKDEPFRSMWVSGNPALTLRRTYEYAASVYPTAVAELRIAEWYANELLSASGDSISAELTDDYREQIRELISAANDDIAYMKQDGTMLFDLRYALLLRANVIGVLNQLGDNSLGYASDLFSEAVDEYAKAGPGHDCIARYQHALFVAQSDSASEVQISTILGPLSSEDYIRSNGCSFLKAARSSAYHGAQAKWLASRDAAFRALLVRLGWTAADFSS